jgi:hypothetical protein
MAEFVGSENQISVQQRVRDRHATIAATPGLANGGRILHVVDPEAVGWERVVELANEDRLAGFPSVKEADAVAAIHTHLGSHWKTPAWNVFLGPPERVVDTCRGLVDAVELPSGWRVDALQCPESDQLDRIQALNAETGVSPYPAYYMRSEAVPVLTVCISDGDGSVVATASAAYRYHAHSRLAGTLFAGMVSVSRAQRGRGLGRLANAAMLIESHAAFKWTTVKEQVASDNPVSRAMVEACGLDNSAGLVSLAAINTDESFSR